MRTIELDDSPEFIAFLQSSPAKGNAVREAVEYLSLWGIGNYDIVRIQFDPRYTEFLAVYNNSQNGNHFVMGAVWREEETGNGFSFHS